MQIIAVSKTFYVDLCELRCGMSPKLLLVGTTVRLGNVFPIWSEHFFLLPSGAMLKKICREEEEADGPIFQQDVISGRGTFGK